MSSSPPTITEHIVPESNHRDSTAQFARWALAQLDLPIDEDRRGARLRLPEVDRASFAGQEELNLSLSASAGDELCEAIELDSRFGQWLLARLHALGPAVPIRPADQPTAVKDIVQILFASYQVDGGRVHLGGCQLTDYPFLRLTFAAHTDGEEELRHVFVAHDGSAVSDRLADELGLLDVEPILHRPPRIDDTALNSLITAGRRVAAQTVTSRDPHAATVEPTVISVVWVKHASGQLHFTVGETTVSLPFSGWAKRLEAQPYTSPLSGASGFHLAATDDGRIDIFDQIATCQQSGCRVLQQELVTCGVTGKHVLEEFTEACPVSGKPCLSDEFASCSVCQQRVSKLALDQGTCSACRAMAPIKKDDPRVVWILGEHPGLDRWNHWQLAETKNVYIAQASSWTKRLLVVVDKETLDVHHLASSGRLATAWTPLSGPARSEILQ